MAERPVISVPWRLMLRRVQYQMVPIGTMILCTILIAWLWARNVRSVAAVGEVNAVRVAIESKIEAMLMELPQPVRLFDTVRKGQVIARLDLDLLDKQVQRLQSEIETLKATAAESPAVREREALIAELRAKLDARDIKSPIDGTVMEIRERPGQTTKLTKPIMTIAADRGDFIVAYVRENQMIHPTPGMAVTVRTRGSAGGRSAKTYVGSVAPQVEPLPLRYLRRADVIEWGLPVQIVMPGELELKPGEMVDLVFHPDESAR